MSNAAVVVTKLAGSSPAHQSMEAFARDRMSVVAAIIVVVFLVMAFFAPWFAPHDPNATDLMRRLQPPAWEDGGSWAYLLGCDALGRDVLSRIIHGARPSIVIGVAVVGLAMLIGVVFGLLAGYLRGWTDAVISRVIDILLGFPYLVLVIAMMALLGPGLQNIILTLVVKEWVVSARVVRGEVLAAREQEYVEAARALGASRARIMFDEILPNILSPVVVISTIRMAQIIILEASLSFLGLGVQPPLASWGSMVADGRSFILDAWWISSFPGVAILLLVLSINVTGQGLRDAFDPKHTR